MVECSFGLTQGLPESPHRSRNARGTVPSVWLPWSRGDFGWWWEQRALSSDRCSSVTPSASFEFRGEVELAGWIEMSESRSAAFFSKI